MLLLEKLDRLSKNQQFQQFKLLLKRLLGYPVVKIELDETQLDLAIYNAIRFYQRHHYDGSENIFIPVQINDQIRHQGYVDFPDTVIAVNRLFDFSNYASGIFSLDFILQADATWEAFRNSGSMQNYAMTMQYLSLAKDLLRNHPKIRFTYTSGKCYIDVASEKLDTKQWLLFDCQVMIDPEHNHRIYDDPWLTDYAIALIKMAWGNVLKKYQDVPLPGGIKMNGQGIYDEGKESKEKLEEELRSKYQLPPMFIIG